MRSYADSEVWNSDPKISLYRSTMQDGRWYAYPGPISQASGTVLADYVMVDMVASVCTGANSPEDAVQEAERRAKRYFRA